MSFFDRFTGGPDRASVLAHAAKYAGHGIATSLSFLPQRNDTPAKIAAHEAEYHALIDAIADRQLPSDITIKLHQFGIYSDPAGCAAVVRRLVAHGSQRGVLTWIDMEQAETVTETIKIFEEVAAQTEFVGLCLQAYLRRTPTDLARVLPLQRRIRLVKGFYGDCEFASWAEVGEQYRQLATQLHAAGHNPGIATHDPALIAHVAELQIVNPRPFEFQYFRGVRDAAAIEMAASGQPVRIYIPYGDAWGFLRDGWRTFDIRRQLQRAVGFRKIR